MLRLFIFLTIISTIYGQCGDHPECNFHLCKYDEENGGVLTKLQSGSPLILSSSKFTQPYFVCPSDDSIVLTGPIKTKPALVQAFSSSSSLPTNQMIASKKFRKKYFSLKPITFSSKIGLSRLESKGNQYLVIHNACVQLSFKKYSVKESGKENKKKTVIPRTAFPSLPFLADFY